MTKREAWEAIAEAFMHAGEGRRRHPLAERGLCFAIANMPMDFGVFAEMDADLALANPHPLDKWAKADGHWWPIPVSREHTPDCDFERAMLAQLLAEVADD